MLRIYVPPRPLGSSGAGFHAGQAASLKSGEAAFSLYAAKAFLKTREDIKLSLLQNLPFIKSIAS